jgi:NAD(P)H-flavin reductase
MNHIQRVSGTITGIRDLSLTAREYTITPKEPFTFTAGAFVNLFVPHNEKTIRRAFSISSSDTNNQHLTLSIRHNPNGELTSLLWNSDFMNREVSLMGPLGINTADKMRSSNIYLFGFGVGAGVVKSLATHISNRPDLTSLTIITGSRTAAEILHRDYFTQLAESNKKVAVTFVLSDTTQSVHPTGYIQDHLQNYNFDNADVYMCGQSVACEALRSHIENTDPKNCHFFVEDFH